MASLNPSRFNNYSITTTTRLTADVWNASVGDLALRMVAVEQKATGYDQIVQAGIGVALDRINTALVPAVTQVQSLITQTQTYLAQLQGNAIAATLITTDATHQFVTADMVAALTLIRSRSFYLSTM